MHQVLLHFSLISGVGPASVQKIIERKPNTIPFSALYDCSISDWITTFGFSPELAQGIVAGLEDRARLDRELSLIEKYNVSWMTILDPAYPALLKQIHSPPAVLYWYGALPRDDQKRIAIVGSRDANAYGERAIASLVPSLVAHGFEIVSGGAIGADTMAHKATLACGGVTIAVTGTGLLNPYPYRNKKLFEQISDQGGAVISIFPLEMGSLPHNFPARNRVISGLSDGCIVVQAAEKSGARITAQFALDDGREVFAVPGIFDDPLSAGCHALIHEGATLVSNVKDVLRAFGYQDEEELQAASHAKPHASPQSTTNTYTPAQRAILKVCETPASFDELAAQTNLNSSELQGLLFDLQLEGAVRQDFTGMWEKVR